MLEEYLKLYEQQADRIDGWRKANKNYLCNEYIKNENDKYLSEAYFSAIVARYWASATRYYKSSKFGVTDYDCYTWLIESILYALKNRVWLKEGSSLYMDPNGPDKAINIKLRCSRLTHYQLLNKDKRVSNLGTVSIDRLEEESGDYATEQLGVCEDPEFSPLEATISGIISSCIANFDYFTAILLDFILNKDVIHCSEEASENLTSIDKRKVRELFENMSEADCIEILDRHGLSHDKLTDIIRFCERLTKKQIYSLIDISLSKLRNSKMKKLLSR